MIQFKNTDETNIDVMSNGNFLGEINFHRVKGWVVVSSPKTSTILK